MRVYLAEMDIELGNITFPAFKVTDDLFYNMHAGRWMTVYYLSADDCCCPGENPFTSLREVRYFIIGINKGDIHWKGIQYSSKQFGSKGTGG